MGNKIINAVLDRLEHKTRQIADLEDSVQDAQLECNEAEREVSDLKDEIEAGQAFVRKLRPHIDGLQALERFIFDEPNPHSMPAPMLAIATIARLRNELHQARLRAEQIEAPQDRGVNAIPLGPVVIDSPLDVSAMPST